MTILGANVQIPPGVTVKPSDQAWNPTLFDADVWWRADTVTITSGKVSQLADRKGNGNTISQSDASRRFTRTDVDPYLGGRPSLFASFSQGMVGDTSLSLAWFGIVCYHTAASFGGIFEVLASRNNGAPYFLQGNAGTTQWLTNPPDTIAGTRKRNGAVTDTAFTSARQASFYEFIPDTPTAGAFTLFNNFDFNAGWQGNFAEFYGKTTVPSSSDVLQLRAFLTGYYSNQL
jgi:hypothetical protein